MIKQVFYIAGAVIFTGFALLQLNDLEQYGNGDAWSWVLIYGLAALLNLLVLLKRASASMLHTWFGFSAGALLFRLQDDVGNFHLERLNPSTFWNERAHTMVQHSNECGGLAVLLLWAIALIALRSFAASAPG